MPQDQNHLIWLDMEMSGLNPEQDRILEVACVITNSQLEMIHEGTVWVIHQSDSILDGMDQWNKKTHSKSGLIDKVKASTLTEEVAADQIIALWSQHVPHSISPLCGNSVHQDRRFLVKYMPYLNTYLHYRNLDVSTLKELCKRWRPQIYSQFKKQCRHEALADIHESIEELRFYRDKFMNLEVPLHTNTQAVSALVTS